MTPTLQRPWPPGTYQAAHATERTPLNEARARAGLPAFVRTWDRVLTPAEIEEAWAVHRRPPVCSYCGRLRPRETQ